MLYKVHNSKLIIILIGDYTNSNWVDIISKIKKQFQVLEDTNNEIFHFETGISKPLLIHVKDGVCVYFKSISDFEVDQAYKYLQNNL